MLEDVCDLLRAPFFQLLLLLYFLNICFVFHQIRDVERCVCLVQCRASFLLHCRPASSGQCPFSGAAPAVKEYIFSRFAIILPLSGQYTLSVQCFLICCQIIYCENQQNFCQRIFSLFMLAYSFLLIMLSHFFEDFYCKINMILIILLHHIEVWRWYSVVFLYFIVRLI